MPEARDEPYPNMRFRVEIDGLGETRAVEVVFPEARLVPAEERRRTVQYGTLVLRRGLTESPAWHDWWSEARVGRAEVKRAVAVMVLDARGRDVRQWRFEGAEPVAYLLSSLNALGHEPLIETLELSVDGFESAPVSG